MPALRQTHRRTTAVLAAAAALVFCGPAFGEEDIAGGGEYLNSCAPCHGVGGRGDGPVAQHLNVAPSDLTTLAERHDGDFPFLKIFQIIDGRALVAGHGERTMPIWGQRYRSEAAGDDPRFEPYVSEAAVRGRILELVNYLQAIQDPQPETTVLDGAMGGGGVTGSMPRGAQPN